MGLMEVLSYLLIIALAVLGVPLFAVMALLGLSAYFFSSSPLASVAVEIYRMANAPTLLAIPLFTFAGHLMAESSSPQRLLRLARSALGWLPGGVAMVALLICAFFTAFTGASGVTIIALGGLLYPILRQEGYSESFSLGLVTTSGSLGLLFPPSLPIIIYGLVARVDIEQLFIAGIVPGTLLLVVLGLWSIKHRPVGRERQAFDAGELWRGIRGAAWELLLPVVVVGGIYGGWTTPGEAAALTAAYVLVMECVIYRELSLWRDVPRVIRDSMALVGAILLILCCAMGVTSYLVDAQVPMQALAWIKGYVSNKYAFLALLNIFLLIVGSLMDIFSAIVVVVPLITPIALEFGVEPLHLAVIFLTNLEIGYITPPVGINLFISSIHFDRPLGQLYRSSGPFLLLLLAALLLITYVPWLSLLGQ